MQVVSQTRLAPPVIVAENLFKRFYATQALDGVSLTLYPGEVHAIVGENGAGKSTLIKILGGIHQPDSGRIFVRGVDRVFRNPREAMGTGIVLIPQELRLVPTFTVAENVMLGHLPTRRALGLLPVIDRRRMLEGARPALARLGFAPDVDCRVDQLPYGEQQLVAIAKALSHEATVLILDEPTAALERREVRRLFDTITALKAQGVAIIYISHRLDEVVEIAGRCTVMRDGRVVAVIQRGEFDAERLIRQMTGRDVERTHAAGERDFGEPLLEATLPRATSGVQSVKVRARQVVGLAGLLGSGSGQLLRRLFGADRPREEVRVKGRRVQLKDPTLAIRAGIGMVPGERAKGLVLSQSVRDNILLPSLDRLGRRVRLDKAATARVVEPLMEALDIRPRDPDRVARFLSGGNQQKVIFAKWLAAHVEVLLLEDPTQGIDVAAKAQIHRLISEFAERGGGVVFASSEINEILSLSDSVLAMRQGEIVAAMDRGDAFNERGLRKVLGG
jgi:ABC-type sugar transport system ATPase subunit